MTAADGPSTRVPAVGAGDLDWTAGLLLQPGPALKVLDIRGVKQEMDQALQLSNKVKINFWKLGHTPKSNVS